MFIVRCSAGKDQGHWLSRTVGTNHFNFFSIETLRSQHVGLVVTNMTLQLLEEPQNVLLWNIFGF